MMVNKAKLGGRNRRKGINYEYKIRDYYINRGFVVVRAAGSRGVFDLVAINPNTNEIKLIQCKAGKITKKEKEAIREAINAFDGYYKVEGELIAKTS